MSDLPEIETKAAFSRRLGASKSWVSQLIGRGMPLTPDGKAVPVAAALKWVKENVQQPEDGEDESSITGARIRLILAQAELAEINVLKERGGVIDREAARRGVMAFARVYRDGVLNFAARQGPEIAHKLGVDPRALIAELEAQLRQLLVDLSKQPMPIADSGEASP